MNEINLKNICIGNSFITLLYALRTSTPCIMPNAQRIFEFSDSLNHLDLKFIGQNVNDIWDRLCFSLNMSGLILFPDNIQSMRRDQKHVEIITKYNKKTIIHFNDCVEFDNIKTKFLTVYDYFWGRVGSSHEIDLIEDNEDFVNKIIFYPRQEKPNTKDLVCISKINKDELDKFENSPNYARLKTIGLMRSNGAKGIKTGIQNGKPTYMPPKIEWEKRTIHINYKSHMSLQEVYDLKQEENYAWTLLNNMTHHISTSLA